MIRLDRIVKTYGTGEARVDAVKEISLEIRENEFVSLIGPSGSGKSTLMSIMGCLDSPTSGGYFFEGRDVSRLSSNELAEIRNEKIGFVFQSFNLLPYATAFENVEMPMVFKGVSSRARKERAMALLDSVRLSKRARHKPSELSGGEIQRVSIARALANDPKLILADEPTGNLDTKAGDEILAIFDELWKQGRTLVLITHNPDIARITPRVISLHDGRIVN
ncbi:MAG: ABC transporter ATP-binding protein [Candidatus Aminicenantales bacterium]